jgi:hypothetical protein
MEILTNILTEDQFRQELAETAQFLSQRGISEAAVTFGFTPDCPDLEDVGVPHVVPVTDVASFVADRERTKGFRLGVYDCWIEPSGLAAHFLFCNDSDIHFTSESDELLDLVRARWRGRGFHVYPDDLDKKT